MSILASKLTYLLTSLQVKANKDKWILSGRSTAPASKIDTCTAEQLTISDRLAAVAEQAKDEVNIDPNASNLRIV